MRIRSGGEPTKRGSFFANNFLETHPWYKNFGRAKHRKPFPSNIRRKRQEQRELFVAFLRETTATARTKQSRYYEAVRMAQQSTLLSLKDFSQIHLEHLLKEFVDATAFVGEKLGVDKLFRFLKNKWEIIKPVVKPETLPSGSRLMGVKFFLWGIPNPFFVTVYELRQMLARFA